MNKLKQSIKQTQRKVLSPQTRQAIDILQFNSLDLHREIENIILENPFLEQEVDFQPEYNLEHSITSSNTDIEDILNYHYDSDNLREHLSNNLKHLNFLTKKKR